MEGWVNEPLEPMKKPPTCPGLCSSLCSVDCDLCLIHIFSDPPVTTDI